MRRTLKRLAIIGGIVGLDATSFPQAMLSRPLVAGALAGLVFHRPLEGMLIGAVIEIFDLSNLPIGAARYPDSGTATVAGVGAFGMAGHAHRSTELPPGVVSGVRGACAAGGPARAQGTGRAAR